MGVLSKNLLNKSVEPQQFIVSGENKLLKQTVAVKSPLERYCSLGNSKDPQSGKDHVLSSTDVCSATTVNKVAHTDLKKPAGFQVLLRIKCHAIEAH